MKTLTGKKTLEKNGFCGATALLRLLGTLALYVCFGLLADAGYATNHHQSPADATQGSIWLKPDNGGYINALLLQTEVDFDISSMIARAVVKQRFKNTSQLWAEAVYVFPLPDNAAVDHFKLRIGERLIEGQVQERTQARKSYETAKNEGKRSGLVEQQRSNVFTTSLAQIAPGEEITIEIEYQQTLEYKDGYYRLRFPLVVGPRYQASSTANSDDTDVTVDVADTPSNPVYIHASLDAGVALAELDSSYHMIDIRQTDTHRYSIALAPGKASADRDFELVWRPELNQQPQTAVFGEKTDSHEYMLLSLLPPDLSALGQRMLPRDVVFILDVSGSMAGTSIAQAKAALVQGLARLKPGERFNIIWFNDRTEQLYPVATPASLESIAYASRVINRLDADGGTVMQPALMLALNEQAALSRIKQIIFLTDGNVNNEQELFTLIEKQLGDNRLFTIGIGSAPNSYFMRKAARAGRGTFTYIADINEVQQKTDALLHKLETPALVNIDIQVEGNDVEIFPEPVPDLYAGEPLNVLLRGTQLGSEIAVHGDYGESAWQQTIELSASSAHPGIRTAWARSKIDHLLEQQHDTGSEHDRDRVKSQIIQTSIDHHLVSRYTSLVAVDVTPVNSSGMLYSEKLKTSLPHGWKPTQAMPAADKQILVAQIGLPQTVTDAPMHLLIASMLFSLAMVFYLWRKLL